MKSTFRRTASNVLRAVKNYGAEPTYAQCGEDVIANFLLTDILKLPRISYIDIGAHHPIHFSNTYLFYKLGHRGVCIEPDPDLAAAIRKTRPGDTCLNVGVGTAGNSAADFYVMTTRTLNTFSSEEAKRYASYGTQKIERVIKIPLVPLNDIIGKYFSGSPNFVSLDIEGMEVQVLESLDFNRYRPEGFCIETLTYTEDYTEAKVEEIGKLMARNGYTVYADTYINTIYVDDIAWKKRK